MTKSVKSFLAAIGRVGWIRSGWFRLTRWILCTFAVPLYWRDVMMWPMATYILGEDYSRVVNLKTGPTMWLTLEDTINRLVLFYGRLDAYCYEPQTLRLALHLQSANGSTMTAGAHMGYHALHFAYTARNTGRHVYAFEPMRKYYEQLVRNRELTQLDNLITEPVALAASSHTHARLYLTGARSSIDVAAPGSEENYVHVDAVSLDDYVQRRQIERVDLILLDVEGSELNVLHGAHTLLASKPDLILEVNRPGLAHQGKSPDDLYGFLFERGYQLYFIADDYFRKIHDRALRKIVLFPLDSEDSRFQPDLKAFNIVATCTPDRLKSAEIVIRNETVGKRRRP